MSNNITLRIDGLPALLAKLNPERMIGNPVRVFFVSATGRIQGRAVQHAAVDTGAMRAGIHSVFDSAVPMSFAQVIAPVEYSPYQEFGTYKMAAHPFMRPALDESAPEITGPLLAQLAANIERGMAL